jgi:hypothetical protein
MLPSFGVLSLNMVKHMTQKLQPHLHVINLYLCVIRIHLFNILFTNQFNMDKLYYIFH